ncbi:MAG: VCBS repeat-containing protein, partial [Planctomycetes bacterium]|nr:VCBS repeat-containing protein [Planctomycetota bacterium]
APWTAAAIHAEPTAHRIRWADVDGDRRKELITAPIVGRGAKPPGLQEAPARLMCQWVPKDPVHDAWPEQIIDQTLTVVHGLFVIDWDGDGRDELLTASNQGIHLFKAEGGQPAMRWSRTQLAAGHAGEPPNRGSSEVGVGQDRRGARFLATIEPWHGHEVVVYTPPPGGAGDAAAWQRHVIDDSLRAGHALCCVDLDRDGGDEIVAGYRGEGTSLYGYRRVAADPPRWERFIIDASGIAAQGCVAADVNGDGWLDLVATGGTTHNVRLYLNETQRRP